MHWYRPCTCLVFPYFTSTRLHVWLQLLFCLRDSIEFFFVFFQSWKIWRRQAMNKRRSDVTSCKMFYPKWKRHYATYSREHKVILNIQTFVWNSWESKTSEFVIFLSETIANLKKPQKSAASQSTLLKQAQQMLNEMRKRDASDAKRKMELLRK